MIVGGSNLAPFKCVIFYFGTTLHPLGLIWLWSVVLFGEDWQLYTCSLPPLVVINNGFSVKVPKGDV